MSNQQKGRGQREAPEPRPFPLKSWVFLQRADGGPQVLEAEFPEWTEYWVEKGLPGSPFAGAWGELTARAAEGDEIWAFSTSQESWQQLYGRAGFVIVRSGLIVDGVLAAMN